MANMMVRLSLIIVFFVAGYQRATWFRRRYGRTGWNWPPIVWGFVCAFSLFLGILLLAISEGCGSSAVM